jgi:transcriptional regulator with XRE-family HTH domain
MEQIGANLCYTVRMKSTGILTDAVLRRIREVRESIGLTQKDIAIRLSLTEGAYRHYENGVRGLNLEMFLSLPRALGVPITRVLPSTLLTDYDLAHAADPRLEEINRGWYRLSEPAKDHVLEAYRFGVKRAEKEGPAKPS